ncbi:hypothetical protein [Flavobacterium sp. N1994]|uniref:hypothetical protein n=1 Tax=Flavobacterium sp. N1994 TaxID=2986827 RepID=UPI0022233FAE|nr:hypothetical protein [Flavobacterium sp. N1994]
MKSKLISILSLFIVLTSCKNKEESQPVETPAKAVENKFTITLEAKVIKDDAFHIYYSEDGSQNFTEDKSVWVEFKGNPNPQKIKFELPENIYPTMLRLDLGTNKDQENIEFINLNLKYFNSTKDMKWGDFLTYFRPNELVTGLETNLIKPIKKDPYVGPSFFPMDAMKPMLENFGKSNK